MDNISHEQRSNIRKARQRDPIVSVFMHNHTTKSVYSMSVPASKSWLDFMNKIRKQFHLPSDTTIKLYQSPLDYSQTNDINLNDLHEYDIHNTNMSKIIHTQIFCAKIADNDSENSDSESKQNKKSNNKSDTDSSSNSQSLESSNSASDNDSNAQYQSQKERSFGIDIDIFDRVCQSKKPQSSKKKAKPIYHYHPTSEIQSLDFHLKNTWLELKTQPMMVKHIDSNYTLMQDQNKQFSLRTRRLIWPRNLQFMRQEFEYRLTDISSKWIWAILIIHGGKFAGAVYHGNTMILHKTLRRYVTRKKQGKRQVNHLSTSGVKGGSAGGYKRAWNEKKLLDEIREILSNWMEELSVQCDKIFVHMPGNYNKLTVYGGSEEQSYLYPQQNNGQLNEQLSKERMIEIKNKNKNKNVNLYRLWKKDERIVQIPITTHGVTLREVERVHYWLSTCWLSKNK